MKPLILEVFPPLHSADREMVRLNLAYRNPHGPYSGLDWTYTPGVAGIYRKRLTATEMAAEYHQQAAYVEARTHLTTAAHDTRNRDRLDTLYRFATTPSYDQEPNQ